MEKRRSLDDVLKVVKTGRALSLAGVERTVLEFTKVPVGAVFYGKMRKEFLPDLLKHCVRKNYMMDYVHFLLGTMPVHPETEGISTDLLIFLGAMGYLDPASGRRYEERRPSDVKAQQEQAAASEESAEEQPEAQAAKEEGASANPQSQEECDRKKRLERMEAELDELHRKCVIPFLRLSVRDYMEYLAGFEPRMNALYEHFFARDVDLWETEWGTTVTVGEVLSQATQALVCLSDVKENVGYSEMESCAMWEEAPERPFQRKNIQGTYWPPEDEEGLLAAYWVWFLMFMGPSMVRMRQGK
ncbi:MAG: hypothetical protein K5897_09740 [Eubacterium sp.]|nr:hypothetical protein [Eubacterium sp.]